MIVRLANPRGPGGCAVFVGLSVPKITNMRSPWLMACDGDFIRAKCDRGLPLGVQHDGVLVCADRIANEIERETVADRRI
jgi:hypothetical protein